MENKIRKKKIEKRSPGLIIKAPTPKPLEPDNPASQIFRAAKISESPEPNQPEAAQPLEAVSDATGVDITGPETTAVLQYSGSQFDTPPPKQEEFLTPVEFESLEIQPAEVLPAEPERISERAEEPPEQKPEQKTPEQKTEAPRPEARSAPPIPSPIPSRNFYRKPNEASDKIDRLLSPAESKVYDQLLRLTIGFNKPSCQIRISTLMDRTGYRSDKTVRDALSGLLSKRYIERTTHHNSPLGDEYTILSTGNITSGDLVQNPAQSPVQTLVQSPDQTPDQNDVDYRTTAVPQHRSTAVKSTAVLESKITGHLNTNNKDILDDEVFAPLVSVLTQITQELTGSNPNKTETLKWKTVAEILADELRRASARTNTISSVPGFLVSHLNRRLSRPETEKSDRTRETRRSGDAAAAPARERLPLTEQEMEEYAVTFSFLLEDGSSWDQLEKQFGPGLTPDEWQAIRDRTTAKLPAS